MQREAGLWGHLTFQGSKEGARARREASVVVVHARIAARDAAGREARLMALRYSR